MAKNTAVDPIRRIIPGYRELREDKRLLRDWEEHAAHFGRPPPLKAFDLSRMRASDWAHRFLISAAAEIDQRVFITYGTRFARSLGLPNMPAQPVPMLSQLPLRYRGVFVEGSTMTLVKQVPICFARVIGLGTGESEAYRVAFAPVALEDGEPMLAVLGAFNRRLRRPQFRRQPAACHCADPARVGAGSPIDGSQVD
jgi:hypothetical protein